MENTLSVNIVPVLCKRFAYVFEKPCNRLTDLVFIPLVFLVNSSKVVFASNNFSARTLFTIFARCKSITFATVLMTRNGIPSGSVPLFEINFNIWFICAKLPENQIDVLL